MSRGRRDRLTWANHGRLCGPMVAETGGLVAAIRKVREREGAKAQRRAEMDGKAMDVKQVNSRGNRIFKILEECESSNSDGRGC